MRKPVSACAGRDCASCLHSMALGDAGCRRPSAGAFFRPRASYCCLVCVQVRIGLVQNSIKAPTTAPYADQRQVRLWWEWVLGTRLTDGLPAASLSSRAMLLLPGCCRRLAALLRPPHSARRPRAARALVLRAAHAAARWRALQRQPWHALPLMRCGHAQYSVCVLMPLPCRPSTTGCARYSTQRAQRACRCASPSTAFSAQDRSSAPAADMRAWWQRGTYCMVGGNRGAFWPGQKLTSAHLP